MKKGDLLVEIDPRPYQVAVSQTEATLYRDQASSRLPSAISTLPGSVQAGSSVAPGF